MRTALLILILACLPLTAASETLPPKSEILDTMRLVNDYWISGHPDPGDTRWARATYFSGNMAMYATWPDHDYRDYALLWARTHDWGVNRGTDTRWADNHCVGQTYIALHELDPIPARIAAIDTSIFNMVDSEPVDDWWWVDALHGAMPTFTRLGVIRADTTYFDKMFALYDDTKTRRALYDTTYGLWYRDEHHLPPAQTPNGKRVFWSRGNGWAFAALAKTLEHLPDTDPHRTDYLTTFQAMAAALKEVQRTDGFWNVSLADTLDYPGPETSGTALFTFGMAWGINNGHLDLVTYLPVVKRAWDGMTQIALHPEGKLGFVQGPAREPPDGQPVTYESAFDFAVGGFLLAGSEVYELAAGELPPPPESATNLAMGKIVSSSDQEPGEGAGSAVDDSLWTSWSAEGYPQWIEIDLGAPEAFNITEVAPRLGRAYQFQIEIRNDIDSPYELLVDRLQNTKYGFAISDTFWPVQARFVRLTVTGAHEDTVTTVGIQEFKLFSQPVSGVADFAGPLPTATIDLGQNYPNPFNPISTIRFAVSREHHARLAIYSLDGRHVTTLLNEVVTEGTHELRWNGRDDDGRQVAAGVYFYRLQAGGRSETKRMVLVK